MSPDIMTLPQSKSRLPSLTTNKSEPSTREFIEAARAQPAPMRAALAVGGMTSLLAWASFTPLNFSPLGWVSLVPFILLARIARPTRRMYLATYLTGLAYWLPTLQWMRLGHVTMYTAWLALSVYMAAYFPVCLGLTRVAVHRFRIPLAIAFPVVWVGSGVGPRAFAERFWLVLFGAFAIPLAGVDSNQRRRRRLRREFCDGDDVRLRGVDHSAAVAGQIAIVTAQRRQSHAANHVDDPGAGHRGLSLGICCRGRLRLLASQRGRF